jgi:predicted RecB family nuclease
VIIDNDIINAIIHCKYKAYLKMRGQSSSKTDYEKVIRKLKEKQILIVKTKQIIFKKMKINLILDGVYKDEKGLIPILVSPFEKVQKSDKLFIALQAYFLKQNFKLQVEKAEIIFGKYQKKTRIILSSLEKEIKKLYLSLNRQKENEIPPVFYKNVHCQLCEFNIICEEKLKERDDLSLLGNMKLKEIENKNNKGIFSVKQLSYTFRPNKNPYRKRKYIPELKALAIREQKIFIQKMPELKQKEIEVFIDIESIPDRNFYYLIGIIIRKGTLETEYSFWVNENNQQEDIFIKFIDLLDTYNDFTLYHYGSYEIQAMKRISKELPKIYQDRIKFIIEKSINILTLISNDIYVPTYTNGLKDIASYLGFNWSNDKSSGLQSVIWRYEWEISKSRKFKDTLILYNIEDCKALKKVQDWLISLSENSNKIVLTNSLKQQNIFKWGVTTFALEDFNEINAKAYFDYQRQHIFLRTEKRIRKTLASNERSERQYNKIDKVVNLFPEKCENCNNKDITVFRHTKKTQIGLFFLKSGIKKQIIEYEGGAYRCKKCKNNLW